MDGYALKFDGQIRHWNVVTTIPAGDTSVEGLKIGEAARIFTGAKMPEGADTVIPQEVIRYDRNNNLVFYDQDKITVGSNVRLKGSQCEKGDLILRKGTEITPGVVGLLASVGISQMKIYEAPSVGFIVTGNELREVGSELEEGEIYNSNGPMLKALLKRTGISQISEFRVSDDREELQQIIDSALKEQEVLILSGGISVGDYDYVKECLETSGVQELFYKIKQRPGKPFYAGKKGAKWIFALPGNPASVLSCYNQYVKPSLRYLMGAENVWSPDLKLSLAEDQTKKTGFTFFVKALIDKNQVEVLKGQQSFNLQAFSTANCLVELEENKDIVPAGTLVPVYYI